MLWNNKNVRILIYHKIFNNDFLLKTCVIDENKRFKYNNFVRKSTEIYSFQGIGLFEIIDFDHENSFRKLNF